MASSWDSYYVVFLSAILSLSIPALLAVVSFIFFPKYKRVQKKPLPFDASIQNRTILGQRVNVRFFVAANASLVLMTLALELIPCATTLQEDNSEGLLKGLIAIISLASFSILGLLYAIRKGDMGWLSSFQKAHEYKDKSTR
jgi:NADH:ubiquinone oxidoreductase subunit 3 (subunit A)